MDTRSARSEAAALLEPVSQSVRVIEPDRVDAVVDVDSLLAAVRVLRDARWGYLAAITGLDLAAPAAAAPAPKPDAAAMAGGTRPAASRMEVLYHFCEAGAVVTLRVPVAYDAATVPSIGDLIPSARLYEVELAEMFGIVVNGLAMKHLLLPEHWPADVHPLRKSFSGERIELSRTAE